MAPTGDWAISEKFAIGAAVVLLALVLIDNAYLTFGVSIAGLTAGVLVARRDTSKRSGLFALAGFAIAAVLAAYELLR
jgi:hypothetical protein